MSGGTEAVMGLRRVILVAVGCMQLAAAANSEPGKPSFDCAKAASYTEGEICASVEVSERDRQVATAYRTVRDKLSAGQRAALARDQQAWLEKRDGCCGPGVSRPEMQDTLLEEYGLRLRELDAIAERPEIFTERGWDLDHPTIHGDGFASLPADTKAFVYRQVVSAFHPERLADRLAGLTLKDSHSGELFLSFRVQPVCRDLSYFAVAAQRTTRGKSLVFWGGVFYKNEHFIEAADFDPDAVQKCTQESTRIVVETDDDYDPRAAEYVVTNVSRYLIDTTTHKANVEKD